MKRVMDFIREILLAIEAQHDGLTLYGFSMPDYSIAETAYHCKLLHEQGFFSDYNCLYAVCKTLSVIIPLPPVRS